MEKASKSVKKVATSKTNVKYGDPATRLSRLPMDVCIAPVLAAQIFFYNEVAGQQRCSQRTAVVNDGGRAWAGMAQITLAGSRPSPWLQ